MGRGQDSIGHIGKVVQITPEVISVEIVSESACASCHASALCSLSSGKVKVVELPTPAFEIYSVGEEVEVLLKASMGHKAVWLAYVVPLVILIATLLLALHLGAGELGAGLACIAAVAVYYMVIYAFRKHLKGEYVFVIRKKS